MASASDEFLVRPYAASDSAAVLALLRQVWAHKHDVETQFRDRWWWQFEQPPLYVVETAQRTLGGLCAYVPFTLRVRGGDVPSAWFVDFYVLPQYQGRGLGRRLTCAVQERFPMTASLSQTAMAWRVFQKMGWHERAGVTLYMHPYPARWLFRGPSASHRVSTHAIAAGLPAAADLDRLWSQARDAYEAIARRDSAHILQRYESQGGREYVLVCCHRGPECTGYMIVRAVRPVSARSARTDGLIVDYLLHPDDADTFAALLGEAARVLRDAGAERLYCISTSRQSQRVLTSRGFLSPGTPLLGRLLRSNVKWLTFTQAPGAGRIDPAAWFLTMGDCDIDYAWHRD
jgi:GNAT superfamily N-acetyltransferase